MKYSINNKAISIKEQEEQKQKAEKIALALSTRIDNLKQVFRRTQTFIRMLKILDETEINKISSELRREHEFLNVCHRAKQEIENLYMNKSEKVIQSYFDKMVQLDTDLMKWFETGLTDQSKAKQVNSSLVHVREVFQELKKYSKDEEIQTKIENTPTPELTQSEILSDIITHENSVQIVEKIKIQYKNIRGKELRILLKAMKALNWIKAKRQDAKFHDCCKNEFNWNIGTPQAMEEKTFNKGQINKKSNEYEKSDDEMDLEKKIQFLESITKA